MNHKVYLIGRDARADIVLNTETVSRLHAEIIVSKEGGIMLCDRASSGGSFKFKHGEWVQFISERFSTADRVRFGAHEMSVGELMELIPAQPVDLSNADLEFNSVKRDAITGEIVRD